MVGPVIQFTLLRLGRPNMGGWLTHAADAKSHESLSSISLLSSSFASSSRNL